MASDQTQERTGVLKSSGCDGEGKGQMSGVISEIHYGGKKKACVCVCVRVNAQGEKVCVGHFSALIRSEKEREREIEIERGAEVGRVCVRVCVRMSE